MKLATDVTLNILETEMPDITITRTYTVNRDQCIAALADLLLLAKSKPTSQQ